MAGIGIVLDATSEDATNAQLDLNDTTNFAVVNEPDFSPPDLDPQWASSSDTEGSLLASTRHQNRRITIPVRVYGQTAAGLDTQLAKLQQKIGKIVWQQGTLKLTMPSGKTVVFDLLDANVTVPIRKRLATNMIADTTLVFTAKPYGRGTAQTLSLHTETAIPALVFTETGVGGDVPALGKLEITDAQGADQWWLLYGLQSQTYDAASTARLFYESSLLNPQGGATNTGLAGASNGDAVAHLNLSTAYQSILSTQYLATTHLSHVGSYRVIARVKGGANNNGDVTLRFEWSQGDLRAPTANDEVTITQENAQSGSLFLADMGTVHIARVPRGTQQWEGRVLAKAEFAGDDVYIDCVLLIPLEATGEASAVPPTATPTAFAARDEFDQAAGVLTGKTAAIGGAWAGAGDADDFSVVTATKTADRTAVSDASGTPRRVTLPVSAMTHTVAQVDFKATTMPSGNTWVAGLILRYDSVSGRHLRVSATGFNGAIVYNFYTNDTLSSAGLITGGVPILSADTWYTLRALATAGGQLFVWFGPRGGALSLVLQAWDSRLATGGSWASGVPGFFDSKTDANAQTRSYDNFWAAVAARDAAVFASQSAEVRYDGVIREDSTGSIWSPVSSFEGDYLRIPPAGQEAHTARFIVKASRNDPRLGLPDVAIDDLNGQLTVIPRFLVVPE
jgi:hypothetical protein